MPDFLKTAFSGGEISTTLYGRLDLDKYAYGAKNLQNFFVLRQGGISNRAGLEYRSHVKDNAEAARVIPFTFNTEQTYILVFQDLTMRVIRDGDLVTEPTQTITGATQANPVEITVTSHPYSTGDEVYIDSIVGMTELNGRYFTITSTGPNTFTLDGEDGTGHTAYTSGGTSARVFTLATPYAEADLFDIRYTQSGDVMTLTHPSYAPRDLSRTAHYTWTLTTISFAAAISAPTGVSATVAAGGTGKDNDYVVTAFDADAGEESVASSSNSADNKFANAGDHNTITWNTVSGADKYNIYKGFEGSGYYGYIGSATNLTFGDHNFEPDFNDSPVTSTNNPFSGADDYPACVAYLSQRKWFAQTNNDPQKVWATVIGNYDNMNVSSSVKDDDAIEVTLAAEQINEIRHLVPLRQMIVLTAGGEWVLSSSSQNQGITPFTVAFTNQSYYGSSEVRPLIIGDSCLFITETGNRVRDIRYNLEADGYSGGDLTVLADHLFTGKTIIDWAYAQDPHSIVYAVQDDGTGLMMTYSLEHQIWAWTPLVTDGTLESVAVVQEGATDAVYFVVKRNINGSDVRYIERLHDRTFSTVTDAFFVDAGVTVTNSPASTTVSGLDHLEGEAVSILADGNVVSGKTVSGGAVTLDVAASTIHIGLAYEAQLEPLDAALRGRNGQLVQAREVTFWWKDSRGGEIGATSNNLYKIKQRQDEDWGDPTDLKTVRDRHQVDADWDVTGKFYFRQAEPLPTTILAMEVNLDA